jgi:ribonuclease BN (tRNA processing enzyme)
VVGLTLTVLGCTGSYPGPEGACSGYLVEGGGATVLVDAGPGTVSALQRHTDLSGIDAVVLSHVHADHWSDLGVMRTAWHWGLGRIGLPVYGTADTEEVACAWFGELAPELDWTTVADGDHIAIGGVTLTFSRTDHYVETLAVRIASDDASIVYSADTGPGWSLEALGPAPDLALVESTLLTRYTDESVLHLTAYEAGQLAAAGGADRLIVTHLPWGADEDDYRREAEAGFGGVVHVARQFDRYEL